LTDPPYNTGEDFRYNDKWDKDPNDPELGELVPKDDGSRHSKWLRFMTPRIWMMREMLKPGGVIAICIDHREVYRLGMLMDEIFREENRVGIINWQKSYAPRSQKHMSTAHGIRVGVRQRHRPHHYPVVGSHTGDELSLP
jgi:adenine-specific DNA-methyltransferase